MFLEWIKMFKNRTLPAVKHFFAKIGRGTVLCCVFLKKYALLIWRLIKKAAYSAVHCTLCRELKFGFQKFAALCGRSVKSIKADGFWKTLKCYFCSLFTGVKQCRVTARAFFSILAPLLIIAVLVSSAYSLHDLTFANGVTYGGEYLGTVKDASVLTSAIQIFNESVSATGAGNCIEHAHLTTNLANRTKILDEAALAESMLEHTDSVSRMYGLYVNDILHAVVADEAIFNRYLTQYLDAKRIDDENAVYTFNDNIVIKEGYFPATAIRTEEQVKALILENVLSFSVKKTVVETYNVEVAYQTKEIQSSAYNKGYRKVQQNGINGKNKVTANVTYIDGVEISRDVISSEVITEPVDKKILVGTKVTQNSTANIPVGGSMLWPLQKVDRVVVTSYWGDGRNHKGVDIAAPRGTHIYAVRDGTVSYVKKSNVGYGYLVKVRHSDSVETWYAHCSGFNVSVGDVVKAGEVIAFVGTTGDSTGYHLHFEVRINGTPVNPGPYIGL